MIHTEMPAVGSRWRPADERDVVFVVASGPWGFVLQYENKPGMFLAGPTYDMRPEPDDVAIESVTWEPIGIQGHGHRVTAHYADGHTKTEIFPAYVR